MSSPTTHDKKFSTPRGVYVAATIEFLATFGGAITSIPSTRLIENAVCQRHFNTQVSVAEHFCKDAGVQTEMAAFLGAMASFGAIPGLVLTIPYGVLAEHVDRRFILLANVLSNMGALSFTTSICTSTTLNLKLLWLSALFELAGGGGTVFMLIIRTVIAESVPSSHLSKVLYRLSAINLLVRLVGVSVGSWLSRSGPASAMLIGISIFATTIPAITYLPKTTILKPSTSTMSHELSYIKVNQDPKLCPEYSQAEKEILAPKGTMIQEILTSFKTLYSLIISDATFKSFLLIMFFNTIALGCRSLVRPWLSKRYDWSLEYTGYMLSLESILSVLIFLLLPYLDQSPVRSPHTINATQTTMLKRKSELKTSKISLLLALLGSTLLGFATTPFLFFTSTVIISGSAGFIDALRAFFTSKIEKEDIGKLYSAVMVVDTFATVISSPIWSWIYGVGYQLGGLWVGLPFWVSAVIMLGVGWRVGRLRVEG